jgi:RNA polymerase sigma factor (sigma-70 family)
VLQNHHDAEDAFQASFLVLARRAASVAPPEMMVNWLYGVAYQTARKARASRARKLVREKQVTEIPESAIDNRDPWRDLRPVLDQELNRLPQKYRAAIVLCDLEGKSRQEAARQLALPEGTLSGRLTRGRTMLTKRLARHGSLLSGTALAALLTQEAAASACVPASAACSAIQAAGAFTAGQAAATVIVPAKVAALTEGVIKTMWMMKMKVAVAVFFGVAVAGAGAHVSGVCPLQSLKATMDKQAIASASAAASPTVSASAPKAPQSPGVGKTAQPEGPFQHVHNAIAAHFNAAKRAIFNH